MASGRFDLSDNKTQQWAWVTYSESNLNIATNTSDLTVNVYFRRSNNGYTSDGTMNTSVTVNGVTKTASTKFTNSGTTDSLLFSQKFTSIAHNTDGSKTVTISVSASSSATGFSGSGNKSVTLDTIKRASVINSFSGVDIEGNFSAVYTSYSSSFTHKLRISIQNGSTLETFNNYISGTSVYLSNENVHYLYDYMESLPSVNLSAVIETWNGSTKIGESSPITNTCMIDNAAPLITATVVDDNNTATALTGNPNILIKYFSDAKATMTVEAQKGATIDESLYIIRNGGNSAYSTEHTFERVESNEFVFSAEDSRGNVGTARLKPTMVEYIKLTCNLVNNRPDALGNMTVACTGDFFNDTFGAAENTLTVLYRYAVTGGAFGGWSDMNVTLSGNSYYASANFVIPDFSQQLYYSFEVMAIDRIGTASSNTGAVKSTPLFHWGENDFVFEVPVTFNAGTNVEIGEGDQTIDGNLNITGNMRLKGSGNYGNTINFGDGSYCYITEPTDDVLHIKGSKGIHLISDSDVYINGKAIPTLVSGTWTPSLNASAISYYTTQYGWYSRVGSAVTIGFFIKATCRSGYHTTDISITGLPYTPSYTGAGGGMCSGAYISGGYNFQSFVAETDSNITTRVQACNNTSTTNLNTSASGCKYPSGGGELTLSGTITYIA